MSTPPYRSAGLSVFATLSPMPGFRAWLDRMIERGIRVEKRERERREEEEEEEEEEERESDRKRERKEEGECQKEKSSLSKWILAEDAEAMEKVWGRFFHHRSSSYHQFSKDENDNKEDNRVSVLKALLGTTWMEGVVEEGEEEGRRGKEVVSEMEQWTEPTPTEVAVSQDSYFVLVAFIFLFFFFFFFFFPYDLYLSPSLYFSLY